MVRDEGRDVKTFVSVVMPVYNSQRFLVSAIESVLGQTYSNFEFIIVDDGSKDESSRIIQSFKKKDKRIIVITNKENIGVTKSLNKALKSARGKYVIRMDADDWSYKSRFKKQIEFMDLHPDVIVSGTYIKVCDVNLKVKQIRKYHLSDKEIRKRLFRYSPFAHPATIWRTNILKKECYDETVKLGQDYELYFRIGRHGKFTNLAEPLLKLRMHDRSASSRMSDMQSRITIQIRLNAVKKFGYKMSNFDRIYNHLQASLIYLMPVKSRFLIFNFLRRFDQF